MKVRAPFSALKLTAIRPAGWIAEQMERDIRGFAGQLHRLSKEASMQVFTEGRVSGMDIRTWWDGESEGNWIDGLTRMAYLTLNVDAVAFIEAYMANILREAERDGYIGIYKKDWRYRNDGANGELWTFSRMLLALLAYYEATRSEETLEAIRRSVMELIRQYTVAEGGRAYFDPEGEEHDLGKSHGLMVVEPLLMVYDLTGDAVIVHFVCTLYEEFSSSKVNVFGCDCQLHRLLDKDEPFIGHGAHTCEHLRIPLLLYHYTGDERYKRAYENAYEKMNAYLSVSGAVKSDECIGSEKFTCLPLPTAGYEYCAVTEQLFSLHTAAMLTGEGRYADQAEWLLFNAAQALKSHDGKGVAYLSADNQTEASKRMGASWDISPTHDDQAVCCVPNAARIMPYHVSRMWMRTNDGGLAAVFYGPSVMKAEVDGAEVSIEQQTAYPFEETIRFKIKVSRPVAFPLKLRIPEWSRNMQWTGVDGAEDNREGDYLVLSRTWMDGDEFTVRFEMAIDTVQAVNHTVSLRRGPLLFAQNIPAKATSTREYAVDGFADLDYVPDTDKRLEYTLRSRQGEPNFGFVVSERHSSEYVWDQPPVELTGEALNWHAWPEKISLVPIGCTTLRTTCLPFVNV